jgi:hypothetical protein
MSPEIPADVQLLESIWHHAVAPSAFPAPDFELRSDLWPECLGFQNTDPFMDIRGGGRLSMECMQYFVQSDMGRAIISKAKGRRDDALGVDREHRSNETFSSYPLTPALINMTRFVAELFNVCGPHGTSIDANVVQSPYYTLLKGDKDFHLAVAGAMYVLDSEWIKVNGGYMDFPFVMERAKAVIKEMLLLRVVEYERRVYSN